MPVDWTARLKAQAGIGTGRFEEVFGAEDLTPGSDYLERIAAATDEALAVVSLKMGQTYDVSQLDDAQHLPIIVRAAKYGWLAEKSKSNVGMIESEQDFLREISTELGEAAIGTNWPGSDTEPPETLVQPGFVSRATTAQSRARYDGYVR